jgi:hypothetical protein
MNVLSTMTSSNRVTIATFAPASAGMEIEVFLAVAGQSTYASSRRG